MQIQRLILVLMALAFIPESVLSQGLLGSSISPQEKDAFQRRVKGIEQFMKRFNYEEDLQGNALEGSAMDSAFLRQREKSIIYLLDYETYGQATKEETEQVYRFIQYVNTADSTAHFLDFYDEGWYAVSSMKATFKGRPVEVELTLQNEVVGEKQSKWVVVGVKADFLNLKVADPSAFLPPNASGTNFIDLSDAMQQAENAPAYASTSFHTDALTLFFAYLQLGELKMGSVQQVAFHFMQFPGWGIKVEEYNRLQGMNSGWLISNVFPVLNKQRYLEDSLGIPSR